jgi:hypothetical protein
LRNADWKQKQIEYGDAFVNALLTKASPSKIRNPKSAFRNHQGPKRSRYSVETRKERTISARMKLPLNWFSLLSQKL